jgi:alcohol dehydrogenase class IV
MNFTIHMPTKVVFGRPVKDALIDELSLAGVERLMLLTDPILVQQAWFRQLAADLAPTGLAVTVYDEIGGDPTTSEVDAAAAAAATAGAQAVAAVGGGSVMHAAKAVAMVMSNGGNCQEYVRDEREIEHPLPPVFVVPTTAGTGGEVSQSTAIVDVAKELSPPLQHPFLYPQVAVLDPSLTYSLPSTMTAATGMTAFVNALEAYWGLLANPFSDQMASTALKTAWSFLPRATANGDDETARQAMQLTSLWAGVAADQAGHGLIQAVAGVLSAHLHVHYGMAAAMVLPHVTRFNLPSISAVRAQRLKRLAGLEEQAEDDLLVERLSQFVQYLNLPAQLDPALLPLDGFDWDALTAAVVRMPSIANNPRAVSLDDCRDILNQLRG